MAPSTASRQAWVCVACSRDNLASARSCSNCGLRPYQADALERIAEARARGQRRLILCAPVGAGKTSLAAHLVKETRQCGERALFCAHRRELIRQPFCRFVRAGIDPQEIGIIMAGVGLPTAGLLPNIIATAKDQELWRAFARRRPNAPVQIASIDSLRGRDKPHADLVIVDEAHRTLAPGYLKLLEHYPDALVIGLTATPGRGDKRGLGEVYEEIVRVSSYRELAEQGYLVVPRVFTSKVLPDVSQVRIVGNDYSADELAKACNKEGLIGDAVDHYQRRGNDAPAIVFAAGVEHSRALAARFAEAGIPAAHLDGEMPVVERDRIIDGLGRGEIKVVSNCDVLSEGTDLPLVKCVVLCRPTQSLRLLIQQCGRGSRPCGACSGCRSTGFCERELVVLDHAGNVARHGLPQVEREWSLDAPEKKRRAAAPAVWICEGCMACNPLSTRVCPECGEARPVPDSTVRELEEHDGELVEVAPLADDEQRVAWFRLVGEWTNENYERACPLKPVWVAHKYKERFGTPPPAGCALPAWSKNEHQRRAEFERVAEHQGKGAAWAWGNERLAATHAEERGLVCGFEPPATTEWASS